MAQSRRDMGLENPIGSEKVGVPVITFLFTLDQIGTMLSLREEQVRQSYIYFEGRTIGIAGRDKMLARNIAPKDEKPEWRVTEREFTRWMRMKGFKYYTRAAFR